MQERQEHRPVMLIVLDGWGWREAAADNAVLQARTPNFDRLWDASPHAFLRTSGEDVGLPAGQVGNSEVGHLNIGAGRVVKQDLLRIGEAIRAEKIAGLPAFRDLVEKLKNSGGVCHLIGLVSPGGVHSHQDHAVVLANLLDAAGIVVLAHVFTDGRDVPPGAAVAQVSRFRAALPASARIATISGRYYPMDRDNRWDRVARAYATVVEGEGERVDDPIAAIEQAAARGLTEEFLPPSVVGDYAGMRDGDAILSFNFRSDRMRELLSALLDPDFAGFPRKFVPALAAVVAMTRYSEWLGERVGVLFPPRDLGELLGEVVAAAGRTQLRMAETEKYPHVTYFLNGGKEAPYAGEDRIMVPSPKVATYDLQPEMSAPELTTKAVTAIESGKYDLIVLNFANPDMVGHTGSLPAAIAAVEAVDTGLGRIGDAVVRAGGRLLVIADHGNCELMRDPATGGPHTAHTTNPVPVMLVGGTDALVEGRLADVAPTLLRLMGLREPNGMSGRSLLDRDAARAAE